MGWSLQREGTGRNVQNMSPRKIASSANSPAAELRELREAAGLSQAGLAAETGYCAKTIHRWESGIDAPRKVVLDYLRGIVDRPEDHTPRPDVAFRFVDLFAGIGGLRRAFEKIGGECVLTSEWDPYALRTYRANFSCKHPVIGDIVQVAAESIPDHDVLLAGFPCQPFSIAGVSKKNALGQQHGFACDTQGTLFFEVARILQKKQPNFFLLENVKNLASHDGGRTFKTIRHVLTEELGYTIFWKVIDSKGVVPQHRERIFIVGFKNPTSFSWDSLNLPDPRFGPKLGAILHPEDGSEDPELPYTDEEGKVAKKYRLTPHLWQYLQDYAAKHQKKGNGFGFGLVGPEDVARTLSARYYKDGSEILVRRPRGTPRRLTPRECARLMGFDGPGESNFAIPVSDTRAYKQFGNSVVVPVVEAVAQLMQPYIIGKSDPALQLALPLVASA